MVDSLLEFENFNLHILSKYCMKIIGFIFKRMQTFLASPDNVLLKDVLLVRILYLTTRVEI